MRTHKPYHHLEPAGSQGDKLNQHIESKGSCLLPGAVINERALTNGSASSSSPLCGRVKTGLLESVDDVGDCCDKVLPL